MKKKRIIPLLISAALTLALCACSPAVPDETPAQSPSPTVKATPAPDEFVFTRENFPKMDGSTSMVPLAEAVASVLLGESREDVAELISFSRTSQSFRNLRWGDSDILIAGEPAQNVLDELDADGFEYDMAKIGSDALIFVVSEDNPVDSLTIQQVQKIYTGEITNWFDVGGDNIPIIPFQRNAEAGSQAAMETKVMDGLAMMEPPLDFVIGSMEGLMEAVKSFDGSRGAIGYSVYYYANDMRMADGLKIIAIEDVEPTVDTIRSGDYPFLMAYCTVVAGSAEESSPERIMWNWLQGEEGQALMNSQGYVSVMES